MSDDQLREAVETAVRAEQEDRPDVEQNMVVGEFVVIASAYGFRDGDDVTQVVIIPIGGSEHRILGLLEHARVRMHADVLDTYGD